MTRPSHQSDKPKGHFVQIFTKENKGTKTWLGEHLNHTVVPSWGKAAEANSMEPQNVNSSCMQKPQVLVTETADRQQGTLGTAIRAKE